MFMDDDEGVNVLVDFSHQVSLVRILGSALIPARLTIKAEVLPIPEATELDFEVTFAKIKFWLENIVSRTVAFCRTNETAIDMLTDGEGRSLVVNQLMITPHEPTDEHLAALLQAKMTALSNGTMFFGVVRVSSDAPTGLVWSYVGDWEDDLPSMEQWFNTKPYYFDVPWWARNDISTTDMISKGAKDFSEPPPWAYSLDFIENAIRPQGFVKRGASDGDEPAEARENVVIRGAFRPKVIDPSADD
jgi:hypothetical protein